MLSSYAEYSENKSTSLWSVAHNLREDAWRVSALSPFVFMTDPERIVDPIAIAQKLPKGAAIIYRHFGADHRHSAAQALRKVTLERQQQFLIGADIGLAKMVKADGVHLRREDGLAVAEKLRKQHPDWIISMAGLKGPQDYDGDLSVLDALFISSIFPSRSPSAGEAIGVGKLSELTRTLPVPIYALGGVTSATAAKLIGSGAAGLAAIDGILKEIVMAGITVEDTPRGHRFVYRLEGHEEAELTMVRKDDDLFDANHTGVPKSMGGQGIGKALIEAMSNHARENAYRVIPSCPFVAAMFKRKPEWAEGVEA
ncbi:N-acetyltransferase [Litorimonas sp. RW-G-Af-16]|uniref:N-acetyltransferase n=1 Tax=Litorimonas sp. RW-G-Af-16 TaxID=3241168 RepID=UPI00390C5905